ncbi:MAG: uracil phosphoribosyltransferase [Clostridiales bacterium]|nr:uracil phosphoribosyltransferase [Clostridiales bacterium]
MDNVTVFTHPLVQHKISMLRDINTGCKEFRELIEEVAMLMAYDALSDLPLEEVEITTPITSTTASVLSGKKMAIVPILRAGLGMVNGILALVPSAKVGHIGLYRDHVTLEAQNYYCKLPDDIENRKVIILDPMLATGNSAVAAANMLKEAGCTSIKFMCIIAAPEGIKHFTNIHPDVQLYCACIDEKLNENGYIVPGLGDAGDRIFGTK